MANKSNSPFTAQEGWIICIPYISKDDTFVSEKEVSGEAQQSEVISVGEPYLDEKGNKKTTDVKKGDIILHTYSMDTCTIGFNKYRIVPFSRVLGIKKL